MKTLGIVPIVEGHGEQESIRILLTRTVAELLGAPYPLVLPPIRQPRSKLVNKPRELERAVELGALKLRQSSSSFEYGIVLVLIERRFLGSPYSPPIDQPRLTAAMDLTMCRAGSRSYDKLCRELERRLSA